MTREDWFARAVTALRPMIGTTGLTVPDRVRVSVGFGLGKRTIVGQCWSTAAASDGVNQLFISPVHRDPVKALGTLVHELIHAALNNEDGHRGRFARAARSVGLAGKLTATTVGPDLEPKLAEIARQLGDWGHSPLDVLAAASGDPKRQKNRHNKLVCPCCSYTVRTSQKWIDFGMPSCPSGTMMEVEGLS